MLDFATRAHNHNWRLDPIVRTLMDDDVYKLLMHQFVWQNHPDVPVTFALKNRTKSVKLAKEIDITELRAQLDHARTLKFRKSELIHLAGNTFAGKDGIFKREYLDFLANYQLPDYTLRETDDGQFDLRTSGRWVDRMLWEIHILPIINELRVRSALRKFGKYELDVLYANAKAKVWKKLVRLRDAGVMGIAEFGTRRRHSFLWQEYVTNMAAHVLGKGFLGSSNTYLAMQNGYEAIGTNAHELPMVYACMAAGEAHLKPYASSTEYQDNMQEALRQSQYDVLYDWEQMYDGRLLVMLGDTFGTTQFLKGMPLLGDSDESIVKNWTGARQDSKEPYEAAEEFIRFWKDIDRDPREKLMLFSDGLDVDLMIDLWKTYNGKMRIGFGWGTTLTNDFRDCSPRSDVNLDPISLVCKVVEAAGRPAVKISDNPEKATSENESELELYLSAFGHEGFTEQKVIV